MKIAFPNKVRRSPDRAKTVSRTTIEPSQAWRTAAVALLMSTSVIHSTAPHTTETTAPLEGHKCLVSLVKRLGLAHAWNHGNPAHLCRHVSYGMAQNLVQSKASSSVCTCEPAETLSVCLERHCCRVTTKPRAPSPRERVLGNYDFQLLFSIIEKMYIQNT